MILDIDGNILAEISIFESMKYSVLLIALCVFRSLSSAQEKEGEATAMIPEEIPAVKFEQDGLYGLKNYSTSKVILPVIYLSIEDLSSNGRFIVTQRDQRKGLYHAWSGKMIIAAEYSDIEIEDNWTYEDYVTHGRNDSTFIALVKKNNHKGVYIFGPQCQNIPAEYDDIIKAIPTQCYIGVKSNRYSLFDNSGKLLISNQNKIAVFESDGQKSLFIQITSDQGIKQLYDPKKAGYILSGKYDQISDYYHDQFIVKQKGKYGMVNSMSKAIIPFQYDTLAFLKSYTVVRLKAAQKKHYALLTLKNKVLTKFEYGDITRNGPFYTVKLDKGYSIIDSTGSRITSVYDHIGVFQSDTCTIALKDKSGYINNNGKVLSFGKPRKGYGFTTLNDLYSGLVEALKADNDTILTDFCAKIIFDQGTCEYMRRVNFSYRGVPRQITAEGKYSIKTAVETYAEHLRHFREQLRKSNELQSLRFVSTEGNYDQKPLGTESIGILSTNKQKYTFKIGELLYLDNFWKAFTFPEW
ncbi:WG repeat-containing protein [Ohtaekwangia koreensis]|uniref:WG containing repeat-containing protein n=1 Tax=Ohtaekwangia koreensis TaxID=688867 RepID=A0A1T5ITY3_9BACT|nr:WG repeat-containing protein [Ohtaekwangia koreensis]SKC42640.1 WG containing repeat-containing protein [Ohtaekwangia koreensis]